MSLLSSTQGSPERVWSVLRILEAHGGSLSRDELMAWLNPEFRRGLNTIQTQESAASQTILAALSLEFIVADGRIYNLTTESAPPNFLAFMDAVHARLCSVAPDDPDRVLLEAYAWVVHNTEREGSFGWLSSWKRSSIADAINTALPARDQADEGRKFNETKLGWLNALGLQNELPAGGSYPYITERLFRELSASKLPVGREVSAQEVLAVIAQRMPYLDGGGLLNEILIRAKATPSRHLSRVLSVALRDLHDEGRLQMGLRGDSTSMVQLTPDPRHKIQTVAFFNLKGDRP
jgi:hypothetical protein